MISEQDGMIRTTAYPGLDLRLADEPGTKFIESIRAVGFWEPEVAFWILRYLNNQRTFIDAGAGGGYFSAVASKALKRGDAQIIAVEPHPGQQQTLRTNLRANVRQEYIIDDRLIWPEPNVALMLDDSDPHCSYTAQVPDGMNDIDGGIRARTCTLDDLLVDSGSTFLKLDLEGAEGRVLAAHPDLLAQVSVFVTEINQEMLQQVSGMTIEEYTRLLNHLGYSCYAPGFRLVGCWNMLCWRPLRLDVDPVADRAALWTLFDWLSWQTAQRPYAEVLAERPELRATPFYTPAPRPLRTTGQPILDTTTPHTEAVHV